MYAKDCNVSSVSPSPLSPLVWALVQRVCVYFDSRKVFMLRELRLRDSDSFVCLPRRLLVIQFVCRWVSRAVLLEASLGFSTL